MKDDTKIGHVQWISVTICPFCEEQILKCSSCGEYFEAGKKVECHNGLRHICDMCME